MTRDGHHPGLAGGDLGMWERAQFLVQQGHTVRVVASHFPGAPKREVIDGIEVVRLGGILSLWWRTFWYYQRHCRGRFDVAVVEGFGGSRIPRMTPLYVVEPIITEWHQVHAALFAAQYPRYMVLPLTMLERLTAFVHRNTTVVARTDEWGEEFPKLGFRRDKVKVVPACIGEGWLRQGRAAQVNEPRIVWLGRFLAYKCPDHVLRALPQIMKTVPNVRLVLAGRHTDRAYEQRLHELVHELGLDEHVEFRFDLTEEAKRALLARSRVMALPSSVEGFGIVVLEANACGVPVVASSGVPEGAVEDDLNGLRYPFADIERLAGALTRVLSDDDLYRRLSTSAVGFAQRHSFAEVCARYEQMIEDVVRGAGRRSA